MILPHCCIVTIDVHVLGGFEWFESRGATAVPHVMQECHHMAFVYTHTCGCCESLTRRLCFALCNLQTHDRQTDRKTNTTLYHSAVTAKPNARPRPWNHPTNEQTSKTKYLVRVMCTRKGHELFIDMSYSAVLLAPPCTSSPQNENTPNDNNTTMTPNESRNISSTWKHGSIPGTMKYESYLHLSICVPCDPSIMRSRLF